MVLLIPQGKLPSEQFLEAARKIVMLPYLKNHPYNATLTLVATDIFHAYANAWTLLP